MTVLLTASASLPRAMREMAPVSPCRGAWQASSAQQSRRACRARACRSRRRWRARTRETWSQPPQASRRRQRSGGRPRRCCVVGGDRKEGPNAAAAAVTASVCEEACAFGQTACQWAASTTSPVTSRGPMDRRGVRTQCANALASRSGDRASSGPTIVAGSRRTPRSGTVRGRAMATSGRRPLIAPEMRAILANTDASDREADPRRWTGRDVTTRTMRSWAEEAFRDHYVPTRRSALGRRAVAEKYRAPSSEGCDFWPLFQVFARWSGRSR